MSQDVHGEAMPGETGNLFPNMTSVAHPDRVEEVNAAALLAEMLAALRLSRRILGNIVVLEIEEAIAKAERLGL